MLQPLSQRLLDKHEPCWLHSFSYRRSRRNLMRRQVAWGK